MNVRHRTLVCCALLCCALRAEAADGPDRSPEGNGDVAHSLAAVERILRGEKISEEDLKELESAVIVLESAGKAPGLRAGPDVEAQAGQELPLQKNVYVLRFDAAGDTGYQDDMLRIQNALLQNQLALLRAMGATAAHQAFLGTKAARLESAMADGKLQMKSSARETERLRGETAATGAKAADIARSTADMSEQLVKMQKDIHGIEGSMAGVEIAVDRLKDSVEDQVSSMGREIKKQLKKME
jgi:hypothetical protein